MSHPASVSRRHVLDEAEQIPWPGTDLTLRLPAEMRLIPAGRGMARCLLEGLGARDRDVDDALLVLTELLTNAIEASPGPNCTVLILMRVVDGGRMSIEVEDSGPGFDHVPIAPDVDSARGRGLAIVSAIADEVDVRWDHEVTHVSAVLTRSAK